MTPRIEDKDPNLYSVDDFEGYYTIEDDYFLTKSYFQNQTLNMSMCQWHLTQMTDDKNHFKIIERLGSSHIENEDNELALWLERASTFLENMLSQSSSANTA